MFSSLSDVFAALRVYDWVWPCRLPTLRSLRQGNHKYEASLGLASKNKTKKIGDRAMEERLILERTSQSQSSF